MHASSLENMQRCFQRHVAPGPLARQDAVLVIDVGGADVNGSYREVFADPRFRYLTVDLAAGEGVDLALDDPYQLPFDDDSVDIVVSGQMLEHCEFFWRTFGELVRVLKPDGLLILIAPSGGPIHRYPVDCYRFYPDAYHALAKTASCELLEVWQDERGPWRDLVGVFRKLGTAREQPLPPGSAEHSAIYEQACRQIDSGNLSGGAALLIELAQNASAMWQPYWRLASVALDQGDEMAARDLLGAAIERSPDNPQPVLDLARLESAAGEFEAALDRLGLLLAAQPGHREAAELTRQILGRCGELPPTNWHRLLADLRQVPRDVAPDTDAHSRTANSLARARAHPPASPPPLYDPLRSPPGQPEEEVTRGRTPYLDILGQLHRALDPGFYLEIGVRNGASLQLARCPAIGVDPAPAIPEGRLAPSAQIHVGTSDDYFLAAPTASKVPDLAFIDGMHLFEFALRDFMNIERRSAGHTVVVVDDIYPAHPAQAERKRHTRVWTGDVWKFYRCLAEWRPDLHLMTLDTAPTGLLLICGLDRNNKVLWDNYNPIVRQYGELTKVPAEILERSHARPPSPPLLEALATQIKTHRGGQPAALVAALRDIDWERFSDLTDNSST